MKPFFGSKVKQRSVNDNNYILDNMQGSGSEHFKKKEQELITEELKNSGKPDEIVKKRKKDLEKIVKFLIRQTYSDTEIKDLESWKNLQGMDFWTFLREVGMFETVKLLTEYSDEEKTKAKERYFFLPICEAGAHVFPTFTIFIFG